MLLAYVYKIAHRNTIKFTYFIVIKIKYLNIKI